MGSCGQDAVEHRGERVLPVGELAQLKADRERTFVLAPATRIAPRWRDPVTGFTVRQLYARLTRSNPLP